MDLSTLNYGPQLFLFVAMRRLQQQSYNFSFSYYIQNAATKDLLKLRLSRDRDRAIIIRYELDNH